MRSENLATSAVRAAFTPPGPRSRAKSPDSRGSPSGRSDGSAAYRGLLAGSGADLLHVSVSTGPVPAAPPDELAGLVRPVLDKHGKLVDWQPVPAPTYPPVSNELMSAYLSWRRTFSMHRFIGERAFIDGLLSWARPRCDVSALAELRTPGAHIDYSTVLRLRHQTDRLRSQVRVAEQQGIGIFAPPDHISPSRAVIPPAAPTTLLANKDARVAIGPKGLVLRVSDHGETGPPTVLTSWRIAGDTATIGTPTGSVHTDQQGTVGLLRTLGRGALEAEVRPGPLRTLAAPPLHALQEAGTLAGNFRSGLTSRSGWV